MNNLVLQSSSKLVLLKNNLSKKLDEKLVQFDAWYLVFLAVLMGLAFAVGTALAVWCVVYKGKKFTGRWNWAKSGVAVNVECK